MFSTVGVPAELLGQTQRSHQVGQGGNNIATHFVTPSLSFFYASVVKKKQLSFSPTRANLIVCRRPWDSPWMSSGESELIPHVVFYTLTVLETQLQLWKTFICRFNSAKKDNDFIYHDTVPSLESLASVKGDSKEFRHIHAAVKTNRAKQCC